MVVHGKPHLSPEGFHKVEPGIGIEALQVLLVDEVQFFHVEHGGPLRDPGKFEKGDGFVPAENLVVLPGGPAEKGEKVEDRVRHVAHVPELVDAGCPVALGEFFLVLPENHGKMAEGRVVPPECIIDEKLLRGVGDMVLAPDDVGDSHTVVVDDHGIVVGRHAVAFDEHRILQGFAHDLDMAVDHVVEDQLHAFGVFEDDGVAFPVCFPFINELVGILAVQGKPLGLSVGAVIAPRVGAFVPVEAEPAHARHDGFLVFLGGPLPVGVLNPENEPSAHVTGPQPVEQGGVPSADMERPRRARSESHPYSIRHFRSSLTLDSAELFCA